MKERRKKETNLGADGEIFKRDNKNKKTGNISHRHIQTAFQGIISTLPIFYMHDKGKMLQTTKSLASISGMSGSNPYHQLKLKPLTSSPEGTLEIQVILVAGTGRRQKNYCQGQ